MKLITLNLWGGRLKEPLLNFIKRHQEIDIFCFQEIYHNAENSMSQIKRMPDLNLWTTLYEIMPTYAGYFRPSISTVFGNGIFIKKGVDVIKEDAIWLYENPDYEMYGGNHSRNLQWLSCLIKNKTFNILNVHGIWNGKGKGDSTERLVQSQRIKSTLNSLSGPKILCGDFNLRPDTESIRMIEDTMENLIKTNHISSTRTSYYTGKEKFADYIFASHDIHIINFEMLPDEVSDHAALAVEFS